MKTIAIVVIAITAGLFQLLDNVEQNARQWRESNPSAEEVILGHRIGSSGQEILVVAK